MAVTMVLFEDAMLDPDREKRLKVRQIINESLNGEQQPSPVGLPARKTASADENPFGDGTTVLPGDWKEQPLG